MCFAEESSATYISQVEESSHMGEGLPAPITQEKVSGMIYPPPSYILKNFTKSSKQAFFGRTLSFLMMTDEG